MVPMTDLTPARAENIRKAAIWLYQMARPTVKNHMGGRALDDGILQIYMNLEGYDHDHLDMEAEPRMRVDGRARNMVDDWLRLNPPKAGRPTSIC